MEQEATLGGNVVFNACVARHVYPLSPPRLWLQEGKKGVGHDGEGGEVGERGKE